MASGTVLETERIEAFSETLSGTLLKPEDPLYDEARRVHNGLIDKRPALIARCRGTADVVEAVSFARDTGLEICVRGGGHNVAGRAVADGALMVDLAEMKGIYVDPEARTVRAQGGLNWREFNRETALHGLAMTGGTISTTGVAGLTLGGGLGWLMGVQGLAADNLLSVELVNADGDALNVTEKSDPDLFWALRGGGGNFGVATSFEYRLHPLSQVVGGLVAHPFEAAPELLRFWRDFTQSRLPDELTVFAALVHAPDGSGTKLAAMALCHTGPPDKAEEDIAPIRDFGEPVLAELGPIPYPVMNTLIDANFPKGAFNYWKSSFAKGLDDGLFDAAVERFASAPSPMSVILFEHFHGAVTRVGVTDTAVPHREEGYNVLIPNVWMDPADTERNIAWTRETHGAFRPFLSERRWLNYFSDDDADDAIRGMYGPNYERLAQLKARYDPENVFHMNHNIPPAPGA
jgi:FAD/FMN-containing dehydrogenase